MDALIYFLTNGAHYQADVTRINWSKGYIMDLFECMGPFVNLNIYLKPKAGSREPCGWRLSALGRETKRNMDDGMRPERRCRVVAVKELHGGGCKGDVGR